MTLSPFLLALFVSNIAAFPLDARDDDSMIAKILGDANIAKYVEPQMNRDITDWLAIGDSFSAGITADVPDDRLNWYVIVAPAPEMCTMLLLTCDVI